MSSNDQAAWQTLQEHVNSVVTSALEQMTFLEILPASTFTPYDETIERVRVEILINDPFPGELRLVIPQPLALLMAQNMYVLPPEEITPHHLTDLVAELLNIIAGLLMARLTPNFLFSLNLPELGAEAFLDLESASLVLEFRTEHLPFWVILFGEGFLQIAQAP